MNNDGAVNGAIVSVDKDNGSVTVKLPDEKVSLPITELLSELQTRTEKL